MRTLKASLIGAVAMIIALAAPVGAITYGEPDAGEHPYVGFMIFFVPREPGWFSCSGTLLDADTFLTAGHCAFDVGTNGAETGRGRAAATTCGSRSTTTDVLAGWPARADYPTRLRCTWHAARGSNDPAHGYTKGIAIPHPDYDDFATFPVNYDVGVVELDAPVAMPTYGVLAPLGPPRCWPATTGATRTTRSWRPSATASSRCSHIHGGREPVQVDVAHRRDQRQPVRGWKPAHARTIRARPAAAAARASATPAARCSSTTPTR